MWLSSTPRARPSPPAQARPPPPARRRIVPGEYLAVDPKGRACLVGAVEKQKFVYVLNRDNEGNLTISSPLEAHKSHNIALRWGRRTARGRAGGHAGGRGNVWASGRRGRGVVRRWAGRAGGRAGVPCGWVLSGVWEVGGKGPSGWLVFSCRMPLW